MVSFFYIRSPLLESHLDKIEIYRRQILLTLLPPGVELKLRWEVTLERVCYSLQLSGNHLKKSQARTLLAGGGQRQKLRKNEIEAQNYWRALMYIAQEWPMSSQLITNRTLRLFHDILSQRIPSPEHRRRTNSAFSLPPTGDIEPSLKLLFNNLNLKTDHPVVQAGMAQIQTARIAPFNDGNGRVARLLGLLMLYKSGYDCRGFLCLESYYLSNPDRFRQTTQAAFQTGNLTLWLEFFAEAVASQMSDLVSRRLPAAAAGQEKFRSAAVGNLNERQKAIVEFLDQPETKITNRKIQQLLKVSQITASRDLAKLTAVGMLFTHGRGRSVYYTRV